MEHILTMSNLKLKPFLFTPRPIKQGERIVLLLAAFMKLLGTNSFFTAIYVPIPSLITSTTKPKYITKATKQIF